MKFIILILLIIVTIINCIDPTSSVEPNVMGSKLTIFPGMGLETQDITKSESTNIFLYVHAYDIDRVHNTVEFKICPAIGGQISVNFTRHDFAEANGTTSMEQTAGPPSIRVWCHLYKETLTNTTIDNLNQSKYGIVVASIKADAAQAEATTTVASTSFSYNVDDENDKAVPVLYRGEYSYAQNLVNSSIKFRFVADQDFVSFKVSVGNKVTNIVDVYATDNALTTIAGATPVTNGSVEGDRCVQFVPSLNYQKSTKTHYLIINSETANDVTVMYSSEEKFCSNSQTTNSASLLSVNVAVLLLILKVIVA